MEEKASQPPYLEQTDAACSLGRLRV